MQKVKADAESRMKKSIEVLHHELGKVRTGRAHPNLLEHIMVSYYGNDTPLNQVANVTVLDARTLQVAPWEKGLLPTVEKAIVQSDLGLNPASSGDVLRIPLPPLTEERRRDLIKVVKSEGEKAKVAIRNVRRDANDELKSLLKAKELGEDEEHRAQADIQKVTDKYVAEVDQLLSHKEKELLEI
ncbi:MAG: ribosome recycling factor [Legionellaceae bacterium]|nr:ribosome recycling factor [Legionellaceae bacterium]|tara:strand:- start:44 stop:598 length:555 start_codon:yes stop_codon:yes gene_type:complete